MRRGGRVFGGWALEAHGRVYLEYKVGVPEHLIGASEHSDIQLLYKLQIHSIST